MRLNPVHVITCGSRSEASNCFWSYFRIIGIYFVNGEVEKEGTKGLSWDAFFECLVRMHDIWDWLFQSDILLWIGGIYDADSLYLFYRMNVTKISPPVCI